MEENPEVEIAVYSNWYMSFTPDGKLWAGASNPKEVYELSKNYDCTYKVAVTYHRTVVEEWVPDASE